MLVLLVTVLQSCIMKHAFLNKHAKEWILMCKWIRANRIAFLATRAHQEITWKLLVQIFVMFYVRIRDCPANRNERPRLQILRCLPSGNLQYRRLQRSTGYHLLPMEKLLHFSISELPWNCHVGESVHEHLNMQFLWISEPISNWNFATCMLEYVSLQFLANAISFWIINIRPDMLSW